MNSDDKRQQIKALDALLAKNPSDQKALFERAMLSSLETRVKVLKRLLTVNPAHEQAKIELERTEAKLRARNTATATTAATSTSDVPGVKTSHSSASTKPETSSSSLDKGKSLKSTNAPSATANSDSTRAITGSPASSPAARSLFFDDDPDNRDQIVPAKSSTITPPEKKKKNDQIDFSLLDDIDFASDDADFNDDGSIDDVETRLEKARELIKQKRYSEARPVLKQLLPNTTAQRWLEKIDETELFAVKPTSGGNTVVVDMSNHGPGCLVQGLWFIFIGWWAGAFWINLAYFFMLTVFGIPLSVMMINFVPKVLALRTRPSERNKLVVVNSEGKASVIHPDKKPQLNFLIRMVYFFLIGWWATLFWINFAYFLCAIVIGMPLGFIMFDHAPTIMTLRRS